MRNANRQYKNAVYEQLARMGKALGSGPRLELLDLLGQRPRTVEALAREVDQSLANTSQHLQVLKRAGLVDAEREGVHVTYRLADPDLSVFLTSLRRLAESRLPEIEAVTRAFLRRRDALEAVDHEALIRRVRDGTVTLVDVRAPEEYEAGHIPGALSIPLSELEDRLADLPRDREIVAYCRGPYCVLAIDALAILRKHGLAAVRLDEGVAEWRARGLPVEARA